MKILVAEDDTSSRILLEVSLQCMGHEVVACETGREAWERHQAGDLHLVITDWMMPEMDGLELCRRLREAPSPEYTYIIILTALTSKGRYIDGMRAGADDFLTKPFDQDELEARLVVAERILGLHTGMKQLERLLPICSWCKDIRDESGAWVRLENYLSGHMDTELTHGICPKCAAKVRPA